jgi:hypothetical protein
MNYESMAAWLRALTVTEQTKALNYVSYGLTISAPEYVYLDRSQKPTLDQTTGAQLLGISELQHQLSSQIGHYLDGEEVKLYPVDVFCRILFEKAAYHGVMSGLLTAIKRARHYYPHRDTPPNGDS